MMNCINVVLAEGYCWLSVFVDHLVIHMEVGG